MLGLCCMLGSAVSLQLGDGLSAAGRGLVPLPHHTVCVQCKQRCGQLLSGVLQLLILEILEEPGYAGGVVQP